jgi:hypothetical protein
MSHNEPTLDARPLAADPYAPPTAALAEPAAAGADNARYYVVSATKFWALSVATLGMYGIYWMYRQWSHIKRATRGDEWPVARAIFQVFFVHRLTAEIDQRLRRTAIRHDWAPQGLATFTVLGMIAGAIFDRLARNEVGSPVTDLLWLASLGAVVTCKWHIQRAANAACGDPDGRTNSRFTAGNIVWLVLGAVFWLLIVIGLLMPAGP